MSLQSDIINKPVEEVTASIDRINATLGLQKPDDLTNYQERLWDALFRLIRKMYDRGYIDKDMSDHIYTTFYEQNDREKEKALQGLDNLVQQKDLEAGFVEEAMQEYEFEEFIRDMTYLLPEEHKDAFLLAVSEATGVPYQIQTYLRAEVQGDRVAQKRLQDLLDGDYPRVDVEQLPALPAKTLSPAELRAKFNVAPKNVIIEEKNTPE